MRLLFVAPVTSHRVVVDGPIDGARYYEVTSYDGSLSTVISIENPYIIENAAEGAARFVGVHLLLNALAERVRIGAV